jgi:hypothetical protein
VGTAGSAETIRPAPPLAPIPAEPLIQPQAQPTNPAAGKSKVAIWVLVGFVACLIVILAVALSLRQNQTASGSETPVVIVDSPPALESAPAPADAPPAAVPVQAPPVPAAAPQNPIVGQWKTTTLIGDTVLNFGGDGHYSIKSSLVGDSGVYVFSNDGTLRLQPDAIFSHDIVIWHCQLSGDSMSVVDPDGAGHVYTRIRE